MRSLATLIIVLTMTSAFAKDLTAAAPGGEIPGLGPRLAMTDAPVLYQTLLPLFDRLTAAQITKFPEGYVTSNTLEIAQSPIVNAWVKVAREPGVRVVRNHAVLSTGLIDLALRTKDGAYPRTGDEIARGLSRVAAVLCHELAHPVDDHDVEGVRQRASRDLGRQAREIRADADGLDICQRSGFAREGLYELLRRFAAHSPDEPGRTVAHSGLASHPPTDLRLSSQRFLLTLGRYDAGFERTPATVVVRPGFAVEIARRRVEEEKKWTFAPPADVRATLERLREIQPIRRADPYNEVEYNRLTLHLDDQLARTERLDAADESLLREAWTTQLDGRRGNTNLPEILSRGRWTKELGRVPERFRARPALDHVERLQQNAYYRGERHRRWLRELGLVERVRSREYQREWPAYATDVLTNYLPVDLIFADHANEIIAWWMKKNPAGGSFDGDGLDDKVDDYHPLFQIGYLELFHREMFGRLKPWNRLVTATENEFVPTVGKPFATYLREWWPHSAGHPLRPVLVKAFETIWANRGFWAFAELFRGDGIDWDLIIDVLGGRSRSCRSSSWCCRRAPIRCRVSRSTPAR